MRKISKLTKDLALFGLLFLSIFILAGALLAIGQAPAALPAYIAAAAVLALVPAVVRGGLAAFWRFRLMNQYGMASATGFDSLTHLRTGKYTNAGALASGDIIVANGCVLVSVNKTTAATEDVYIYQGKLTLPKEAPLVISFLDQVWWDAAAGKITKTSAGNTPCGFCVEGALSADTTVTIMLVPNLEYITAAEIGPNAVTPIKMGIRTEVALADADATPTIAQLMTSSIFSMTPTVARAFTTPTAAVMVAGISGATVGTWFDFVIVNLDDFPITLTAGDAGVTLKGNAVVNKGSAFFRVRLDNVTAAAEALTIYRVDGLADLTATGTELNFLDGVAAGTVLASKAAIYDAAGKLVRSSATVAAAGADLAGATQLTAELNTVTGADGAMGVKLPVATADSVVVVINEGAANLLVYPATAGAQVNALGAGNPFTITPGQQGIFVGRSAVLWKVAAATDTIAGLTSTAAELNYNDITALGQVDASKTVTADANKSVDTLRARTDRTLGGTGVPGGATVQDEITKAVTAFSDTVAKDVFTVTIPNAAHAAVIEVDCLGVLGAGGAIGAGESCKNSKYHVTVARTAGVNAVAAVSAEVGTGAASTVAGGQAVTSVVVTASAVAGAVGDPNTFTIKVAITRAGAGADNHTLAATARILNQNATGITIA